VEIVQSESWRRSVEQDSSEDLFAARVARSHEEAAPFALAEWHSIVPLRSPSIERARNYTPISKIRKLNKRAMNRIADAN
jgi:hypothetical protein